ncbi:serine/threonine/tyrosine-interacting-like protein 1 [Bombina bombina]|uniref:serine/threonine/tyrosine-interacting-like protein 1 n=1 Tax=Bombina bombina TaxID=8345 RepID=UPI00235B22C9|nr:serine/threonine/tyrosine-interacting-like protein 1 [Bombina bombina]
MAAIVLCKATELYNILNQSTKFSRLAEPNYLCLLDARSKREYNEGHIITAKWIKQKDGKYLLPESIELDCFKFCVVYDGNTSSIGGDGPAILCAMVMAQVCHYPVLVLQGGYEMFSACYHFFRSQKVFWMPQEIDDFQPYPIEIIPGLLYLGDSRQARDRHIQKDLKIKFQINLSLDPENMFKFPHIDVLDIPVADASDSNIITFFPDICKFIESHMAPTMAVLVVSKLGISRSSAILIAYLMYHHKYALQEAWTHLLKCKPNMRPNRGFVEQLSKWEKTIIGQQVTDISDPKF